jgi:hypothetical protein
MRLYSILSARVPNFDHQRFIGNVANIAHYQKKGFEASQNLEAAQANHAVWEQLVPPTPLTTRIRLLARATKSILRQR